MMIDAYWKNTFLQSNIAMENGPFEDVSPIKKLGVSNVMLSVFRGVSFGSTPQPG